MQPPDYGIQEHINNKMILVRDAETNKITPVIEEKVEDRIPVRETNIGENASVDGKQSVKYFVGRATIDS